jgi:hypothetical protein
MPFSTTGDGDCANNKTEHREKEKKLRSFGFINIMCIIQIYY